MQIKFKKLHPDAVIPTRATDGSAGFDLTIRDFFEGEGSRVTTVYTGITVQIPSGYVGMLMPRSSLYKSGWELANTIGCIDSDYSGEILIKLKPNGVSVSDPTNRAKIGDRIAQLVVVPCLTASEEVSELDQTVRGSGGFGSTGK
jgi:dUTP pyrophosphatase